MEYMNCCSAKRIVRILLYAIFFMLALSSDFSASGNESDRLTLLDLKSRVVNDPFKIVSSWNDSLHLCDWVGVTCSSTTGRVVVLDLEARKLTGSIPHSVGNLTYLVEIRLGDNNFHGGIPQELGQLLQLRHLNLSFNNFSGKIPTNISHCTELVVLNLTTNRLVGQIPHQLCALSKLELLALSRNNLIGTIPSWVGNLSSISRLSLARNKFEGDIPNEVGHLSRLKLFTVYDNNLIGTVPSSLYNVTSLIYFALTQNRLQGTLPPNIGFTLPNLQLFVIGINYFCGTIPTSLTNASHLQILDLADNSFTGVLSHDWGNLKDLERLNFGKNLLGSEKVGDLNFITSLANCTSLRFLSLFGNRFGGALPPSIGNLSNKHLIHLTLGTNMLTGSIPTEIENLINLQVLELKDTYVNGSIPPNIGKLHNLVELYLAANKLSGPIPSSIGNLSSLATLAMDSNKLEGSIPPSLGQCKSLQFLYLFNNSLTGIIPKEVLNLSLAIFLALDHNSFNGPLPSEVGELVDLIALDVSNNKLSSDIPNNLGKCITMKYLNLEGNQFEGTIPQSFEALKGLETLDLSSNNLSGLIPQFLSKFLSLKYLNLSHNNFEGKVPKGGVFSNSTMISVLGNDNLCDGIPELHLPPCAPNQTHSPNKFLAPKVLIPAVSTITFIVILLSILFVCFVPKKSRNNASTSSSANDFVPQISYLELSKSTGGFSMDNLIGSGSFGSVYKGVLSNDGLIVAVKVLNLQQQGSSKSFVDECHILSNIRHRNLLKIITSCSSIDVQGNEFKALVFDFMSNGNLDSWLHPTIHGHDQRKLSLLQRLNIAIDIASGLDYLHNHGEAPILHCDLKPSNVLLDNDMVAHVGDFGLARFMLEGENQSCFGQTMSLALKGSIGYIAPEYGIDGRISIEGDIFSYGILLLEMIIGKRPTNDMFGNDVNIHKYTATALSHGVLDIIDPCLLFEETRQQEEERGDRIQEIAMMGDDDRREIVPRWMEECLVSIIRIGLSCSSTIPRERRSIDVVVNKLQAIRTSYLKFKRTSRRLNRYLFPQA